MVFMKYCEKFKLYYMWFWKNLIYFGYLWNYIVFIDLLYGVGVILNLNLFYFVSKNF